MVVSLLGSKPGVNNLDEMFSWELYKKVYPKIIQPCPQFKLSLMSIACLAHTIFVKWWIRSMPLWWLASACHQHFVLITPGQHDIEMWGLQFRNLGLWHSVSLPCARQLKSIPQIYMYLVNFKLGILSPFWHAHAVTGSSTNQWLFIFSQRL